ncbi:MAG: hypothetical protein DI537_22155 [Stutzerimonas stutzeri]|nr:MAG: hypothetical protein DI537_22155 [Stutzerimonas stutzeri]
MTVTTPLLVGIAADDLTSATDGAAPFVAKGYAPLITADHKQADSPIVSINTDSRALGAREAARATADAIAALAGARILYKTIDSTLRGHVRDEISAAFRASGRNRMVVAPAFPGAGRHTLQGIQSVAGVPVAASVYGSDPVHPARTSVVADLIEPALGRPIVLSAGNAVEFEAESGILILDVETQDALTEQVARVANPETVLWVGSPGLAIALAERLQPATSPRRSWRGAASRVLVVAGSANPTTHEQCDHLAAHGVPMIHDLAQAPPDSVMLGLRAPLTRGTTAEAVLADLARQASIAVDEYGFNALIATGGQTMAAILDQLGAADFILTGEIEPGFPVGSVELPGRPPLTIAMKAGGFGCADALHRAAALLVHPENKTRSTRKGQQT